MQHPTHAVVLAAGLGTRMRPLTQHCPKPLLPLWGTPILRRTLESLRSWGVQEVLINLHHQPRAIRSYLQTHPVRGLKIRYSHEPEILGTGGALVKASTFVEQGPFWMINADIAFQLDPAPILGAFARIRPIAACWLHATRGPRTVECERGRIVSFRSKRPATRGTYTFCGLQLIDPRILSYLPGQEAFTTIISGYEKAQAAGEKVCGISVPGAWWADLGTPAQYLQAHAETAPEGHRGWIVRGPRVRIAATARVARSVLGAGVQIRAGADVADSIIGHGCVVQGRVRGIVLAAKDAFDADESRFLKRARWWTGVQAYPLGPRGSARVFTRVEGPRGRGILIRHDDSRPENDLYAGHARFLAAHGFPVPRVIADDPHKRLALFEDLGDAAVQTSLRGAPSAALQKTYERILDAVLVLHGSVTRRARIERLTLVPSFRPRLYRWEREYFAEHMLVGRLQLPTDDVARILRELASIGDRLAAAPRVLVHRDLQSSNVLLREGAPWFIDFQGMRLGPAVYDLASLLADPYMELDEAMQSALLEYYADRSPDPALIRRLYHPAVVQRLAQALGAFARLGRQRDTAAFEAYIAPGWRMMHRSLVHLRGWPCLRRCVERQIARST